MKKITTVLNSPTKIALFAICCVLIISIVAFAAVQASAGVNANKTLGMDKGVNIALNDAGLRAEDVSDLSAHYDTEDGIAVYEVKFTSGGYEYDYQIKASDGTILEADRDALKQSGTNKTPAVKDKTEQTGADGAANNGKITKAKAKEIALAHAGVSASKATFVEVKLDKEDGVQVYEVEFYSGSTEYDYEIHAKTGEILSFDKDIEDFSIPKKDTSGTEKTKPASDYIGVDKAKSIALNNAGLAASSVTFTKAKLDREDGVRVYEIEFCTSTKEYEYEINAKTGKILDKDVEALDDEDWDD